MNKKIMKKILKDVESNKKKIMAIYEYEIPELTKYSIDQQECILDYVNYGLSPEDIFKFVNRRMDTTTLVFILDLLFWDNSSYKMSDIIIKNIHDVEIIAHLTHAIKYGIDVSKLTLTIKDFPKTKQIMSIFLFLRLGSIKTESELLDIITTCTDNEIKNIGDNRVLSENYDDLYAHDGNNENLMRLSLLFKGIHHKNIGREKINKYIKREHTDLQIEELMIGLANINDECVLKTVSIPRINSRIIGTIIQSHIKPLNERYYHIK